MTRLVLNGARASGGDSGDGGPGGDAELPDWWTIDSTPDEESVEFAGAVIAESFFTSGSISAAELTVGNLSGNWIATSEDGGDGLLESVAKTIALGDPDGEIGLSGATTIEGALSATAPAGEQISLEHADGSYFRLTPTLGVVMFNGAAGALEILGDDSITLYGDKHGFFGKAAVTQPALPTTLNETIDALVALGLVAAA